MGICWVDRNEVVLTAFVVLGEKITRQSVCEIRVMVTILILTATRPQYETEKRNLAEYSS